MGCLRTPMRSFGIFLIPRSKFEPGTFETCKYHGASRKVSMPNFEEYDVVLTTYGTLGTDFAEKGSPIFQTNFFRIVLDEGEYYHYAE